MRIGPGALPKPVIVRPRRRRIPAVVGTIDSAFLGLNYRPHPIGIRPGNRDANPPENPFRQTVSLQFLPGSPAVDRTVKTAPRSATVQTPGRAPHLPQRCEQNMGIAGIEGHIDTSALGILI